MMNGDDDSDGDGDYDDDDDSDDGWMVMLTALHHHP
jgi:hypothetical protein